MKWKWAKHVRPDICFEPLVGRLEAFTEIDPAQLPAAVRKAGECAARAAVADEQAAVAYEHAWKAFDRAQAEFEKAGIACEAIGAACERVGDAYERAFVAYARAWAAYEQICAVHRLELDALHARLCSCPWRPENEA